MTKLVSTRGLTKTRKVRIRAGYKGCKGAS